MPKNLNPADAYRKAQRKKEVKKNKAERAKVRDLVLVKKDTTDLEEAIQELDRDRSDPTKLAELKAELERVNKKKAEYVAEHPEARRLVYRRRKEGEPEPELPTKKARNLFNKNGLPRHPERSIYYDPVMNPYGVAPPGMPYKERPLLPGEVDSEADSEEGEDDKSEERPELPEGTEEVNSDDEIRMPDDPPPDEKEDPVIPLPPSIKSILQKLVKSKFPPPLPPSLPNQAPVNVPVLPPPPPHPPGFLMVGPMPPPPPGGPPSWSLPPGFPPASVPIYSQPPAATFPYPPFSPREQNPSSKQDPLSSVPHQTFQAHRASQLFPPPPPPNPTPKAHSTLLAHPSLPPKPTAASRMAVATIEAAPELRDLKREATAFVPAAVKRRKIATASKLAVEPLPNPGGEESESL